MISLHEGSGSSAEAPAFIVSKIIHDVKYSLAIYGPEDFLIKLNKFNKATNNFSIKNTKDNFIQTAKKSGAFEIAPDKGKFVLELKQLDISCSVNYDNYKELSNAFGQIFWFMSESNNPPLVVNKFICNFNLFKKFI